MTEQITVRPMTGADVDAVADLYQANARDALIPEQRAESGFVQGRMGAGSLRRAAASGSALVAEIDGQIAGATMTHPVGRFAATDRAQAPQHPAAAAVRVALESGVEDPVLYGPSVVAEEFRRRGVLAALVQAVLDKAAADSHRTVLAFMELENQPSVKAHATLGFQRIGGFVLDGRHYDVVMHPIAERSA